ncbi:MAG: NAD(P)H-dependent oxidoreductase [Pseudomonadota bacterium]
MAQIKIAVVVGSIRKDSFNKKLAVALAKLAPSDVLLEQVRIDDLPQYNQDDDGAPTAEITRLRNHIASAQGVIFLTPEYNRSIPGVLKNAIDHASRPWGKSVWKGKPAAVAGITVSPMGTSMAQQHLRNIISYLDMPTLGQPEIFLTVKEGFFNEDGSVNEGSQKFLQGFMDTYVAWVKKHI